jgi:taurine dioxygenase
MAPEHPELVLVTNKPKSGIPKDDRYQGEGWHSDRSFSACPAQASLLRGITLPQIGGDTMFCNGYGAYDTLSEGMKKLVDGLRGVHVQEDNRTLDHSSPERLAATLRITRAAHPIVRVHPDTGRKTLFLAFRVKKLVGLSVDESAPLLQFLLAHATRPQLVYRHVWQKDDLVVWDNRCTMHNAVNDYDMTQVRHMERTTVKGTSSGYIYEGSLE